MRTLLLLGALAAVILSPGCSLKTQHRTMIEPEDYLGLSRLAGLDGQPPWLKAHLPDGGLYLFSEWEINEGEREVAGQGTRMDARRQVVDEGLLTVSVDSVAIFESNVVEESGVTGGLTVLTVLSAGMTAFCITNPKACFGSCPTFYAPGEDGQPLLMAEGFSASVAPALEDTDLDALYRAAPSGETFVLTMTNEALETHIVRRADLLAVPRPPNGRVLAAQDGTWWRASAIAEAVRCRGAEGDCTDLLAACDGRERYSLADSLYLGEKEFLELEFDAVPAGELGLVVASRHSLLSTYLFYQGLAYLGQYAVPALGRLADARELQGSQTMGDLLGRIEVQIPDSDGAWRTVGSVGETGPLAVNVHMLRLPEMDRADPRLRLRMTKGNWRLDHLALAVLDGEVTPERIPPGRVLRNGVPDREARAALTSADRTLLTLPGDRLDLVYDMPRDSRDFELFLESRGYYLEWMRVEWLAEEDPIRAASLFRFPEQALGELAPKFKELEPDMEAQFWGSRYAR